MEGVQLLYIDPKRSGRDLDKIHQLIADNRVDFVAPADYSENSQMEIIVKGILSRMARSIENAGPDITPNAKWG